MRKILILFATTLLIVSCQTIMPMAKSRETVAFELFYQTTGYQPHQLTDLDHASLVSVAVNLIESKNQALLFPFLKQTLNLWAQQQKLYSLKDLNYYYQDALEKILLFIVINNNQELADHALIITRILIKTDLARQKLPYLSLLKYDNPNLLPYIPKIITQLHELNLEKCTIAHILIRAQVKDKYLSTKLNPLLLPHIETLLGEILQQEITASNIACFTDLIETLLDGGSQDAQRLQSTKTPMLVEKLLAIPYKDIPHTKRDKYESLAPNSKQLLNICSLIITDGKVTERNFNLHLEAQQDLAKKTINDVIEYYCANHDIDALCSILKSFCCIPHPFFTAKINEIIDRLATMHLSRNDFDSIMFTTQQLVDDSPVYHAGDYSHGMTKNTFHGFGWYWEKNNEKSEICAQQLIKKIVRFNLKPYDLTKLSKIIRLFIFQTENLLLVNDILDTMQQEFYEALFMEDFEDVTRIVEKCISDRNPEAALLANKLISKVDNIVLVQPIWDSNNKNFDNFLKTIQVCSASNNAEFIVFAQELFNKAMQIPSQYPPEFIDKLLVLGYELSSSNNSQVASLGNTIVKRLNPTY